MNDRPRGLLALIPLFAGGTDYVGGEAVGPVADFLLLVRESEIEGNRGFRAYFCVRNLLSSCHADIVTDQLVSKPASGAAELVVRAVGPVVLGVFGHLTDREGREPEQLRAVELGEHIPNRARSLTVA